MRSACPRAVGAAPAAAVDTWRPKIPFEYSFAALSRSPGIMKSCQNFSSSVIREIRSRTRASTWTRGSLYGDVGEVWTAASAETSAMNTIAERSGRIGALSCAVIMANTKLGFRILPPPPRLADDLVERFRAFASPNLADAMGRFNFMDPGMMSRSGLPLCGRAVTVNCRPADNLMVHKALQFAEPGDIVVVATGGNTTSAVFGGLMCTAAAAKGLGGIVVDGAIRDVDDLTRMRFPAFSRSVCPGGCDKDGPGEINVAISCGSAVVAPGDIVVGDRDGLVIVSPEEAQSVLERARAREAKESEYRAAIEKGASTAELLGLLPMLERMGLV